MTTNEREFIQNNDFKYIWSYLWNNNNNNSYKSEEKNSKQKLDLLKAGFKNDNETYTLNDLINLCDKQYLEPEWGFPKGRRNFQEKDIACSLHLKKKQVIKREYKNYL